jgi:hypothetical protein
MRLRPPPGPARMPLCHTSRHWRSLRRSRVLHMTALRAAFMSYTVPHTPLVSYCGPSCPNPPAARDNPPAGQPTPRPTPRQSKKATDLSHHHTLSVAKCQPLRPNPAARKTLPPPITPSHAPCGEHPEMPSPTRAARTSPKRETARSTYGPEPLPREEPTRRTPNLPPCPSLPLFPFAHRRRSQPAQPEQSEPTSRRSPRTDAASSPLETNVAPNTAPSHPARMTSTTARAYPPLHR